MERYRWKQKPRKEVVEEPFSTEPVENILARQAAEFDDKSSELLLKGCPEQLKDLLSLPKDTFLKHCSTLSLFIGNSGLGKSEMARLVGVKMGIEYEFVKTSLLADEHEYSGSQSLQRIFNSAIKSGRPRIIIFDEMVSLIRKFKPNNPDYDMKATFWKLFNEVEKKQHPIFIIGTTIYPKEMGPELLPKTWVDVFLFEDPHELLRKEIVQYHLDKKGYKYNVDDLKYLIRDTEGQSGRLMEMLAQELILSSVFRSKDCKDKTITQDDVKETYKHWKENAKLVGLPFGNPKIKKYYAIAGTSIIPISLLAGYWFYKQQNKSGECTII